MTGVIVSVACGGPGVTMPETGPHIGQQIIWYDNRENKVTPCQAYQSLLETCIADVIIYIHDDVTIHDHDWLKRVLEPFDNPSCVSVGLGGATSLGHPSLYKRPYRIEDMARGGYRSNQTDWETHGALERGSCRVAVLDAFFMAVRRSFLEQIGGWPVKHLTHHGSDLWLACMAARYKKEIWQVGISCTHWGGGTSVKDIYRNATWLQGGSLEEDHRRPHEYLYNEFRDVLPISI